MSEPLLTICNLAASYGGARAIEGVSLEVHPGEAVALLGANGAGKTTTLRAVMGSIAVEGSISFAGAPLDRLATSARARLGIGYSPEGRRIFPGMTVRENLGVASRASRRETARQLERIFDLFPALRDRQRSLGWALSGGQQQMLAIGRALMTEPRLLLLDEPSLGLSPVLVETVLRCVREITASGTAVLLAEQNAAAALGVADRAYIFELGRIVQSGRAAAMRESDRLKSAFLGA